MKYSGNRYPVKKTVATNGQWKMDKKNLNFEGTSKFWTKGHLNFKKKDI